MQVMQGNIFQYLVGDGLGQVRRQEQADELQRRAEESRVCVLEVFVGKVAKWICRQGFT